MPSGTEAGNPRLTKRVGHWSNDGEYLPACPYSVGRASQSGHCLAGGGDIAGPASQGALYEPRAARTWVVALPSRSPPPTDSKASSAHSSRQNSSEAAKLPGAQ